MTGPTRRCVVLFARAPRDEARRKGLPRAEGLFALAAERVAQAAVRSGFELLVVGDAAPPAGSLHLPQRGHGLAERLSNAFADAGALGYEQVVVVPGDVPEVDAAVLAEAGRALEAGCLVLGPSPDGGVYLLGCAPSFAPTFSGVRWQTAAVFSDLRAQASGLGLAVTVLRALGDVDRLRDLDRLARRGDLDTVLRLLVSQIRRPSAPRHLEKAARLSGLFDPFASSLRGPPAPA